MSFNIIFFAHKNLFIYKSIKLNHILIKKYFVGLNDKKKTNYNDFEGYFRSFFDYCFELTLENMLKDLTNFIY